MSEVKIYSATYCEVMKNVPVAKINGWILRLDTGEKLFPDNFTNLTELTFHPKGEGVWVTRDEAKELKSALDSAWFHLRDIGLTGLPDAKKLRAFIDLLAQLTPSARGGAGEFKDWNDIAKDYEASHPAKVGIELTENTRPFGVVEIDLSLDESRERFLKILRNFKSDDEINDEWAVKNVLNQIEPQLAPAPMPEQEEPKERGAVIKARCDHSFRDPDFPNNEDTYTRFKESNDKPWIAENGTRHNWSDLINPTRVAGAE